MVQNRRYSRRASLRPVVDLLEKRALLNATMPNVKHVAVHAEISAARRRRLQWSRMSRADTGREPTSRSRNGMPTPTSSSPGIVSRRRTSSRISREWRRNTDPNLQGAWGLSFSSTSPFWVSAQAANFNGSGAASVYKVSDTPIPTSTGSLLTVGVTNQGNAPPSGDQTNGPTGQVATARRGSPRPRPTSRSAVPRRPSFSPTSTGQFRAGPEGRPRRLRRPSQVRPSPGLRSAIPRPAPPSSTRPTRTAARSTSSTASGN